MKNSIFLLLMLLLVASCKNRKSRGMGYPSMPHVEEGMTPDAEAMMNIIRSTEVPYTWFAASGQGKIDWDGQRFSARVHVRILRDSIIWVQIQKLGFEVGRMLVTPDSAFFINRFERSYSRYGTDEFLREYNVPADFEMFSKVFTAGAYMPPVIRRSLVETDGSLLLQAGNGMKAQHWLDRSSLLVRSLITDPLDREWSAVYADYKKTSAGHQLPYKRSNTLMIDGQPNIFDLQYSEMVLDVPQEFPFSIPSHYEKI